MRRPGCWDIKAKVAMDVDEKAAEGWNHVEPLGPASIYCIVSKGKSMGRYIASVSSWWLVKKELR